jgi:hypothetical protein
MKKTYGLQNETKQYLRRLYAYGRTLRGEDVNDIDNFVKGLKQLNIGSNYIGWFLRDKYNMGTGSTIIPINRLNGIYPAASLINSPPWGSTGITFSADNHRIYTNVSFGVNAVPRSWSIFAITNWIGPNTEAVHHLAGSRSSAAGTSPWQILERNSAETTSASFTSSPDPNQARVSGWKTICGILDNTNSAASRQGVTNGTGSFDIRIATNNQSTALRWDNFHIGGGGPYNLTGRAYKGIVSYIMIVDKFLTQTDYNNLRLLCKATIGKDLGII